MGKQPKISLLHRNQLPSNIKSNKRAMFIATGLMSALSFQRQKG